MLPPSDIPSAATTRPQQTSPTHTSPSLRCDVGGSAKARLGFNRSAGFKPISQASSSVKMFFPRDDEESEAHAFSQLNDARSQLEIPSKRGREYESPESVEDARESALKMHEDAHAQQDAAPSHVNDADIELHQRCVPSPTLRDATKVPLSPKHNRSADGTASPVAPIRVPEAETENMTRPSSPSGTSPKELYKIVSQVGEGTFGKVYKARNTVTSVHVALKRIRMEAEKDGFPVTAMREIKLLQSLRHQNVVSLYEMMVSNGVFLPLLF